MGPLKHARSHVSRWMKTERRSTTPRILGFLGAKAEIRYQPKGIVGVINPWVPVNLTFGPLAGVLAAGNRAMVKPSEMTPATSRLMKKMFASAFDEEIAVCDGRSETGQAFAQSDFRSYHLHRRDLDRPACHEGGGRNLVPVTLELGGKSPVILGRSADLATSAARIMNGKTLNAGQICLAPDYVLAPADKIGGFVEAAKSAVGHMFPTIRDNPDYTAVIADRHYERLTGYLDDARAKGVKLWRSIPAGKTCARQPTAAWRQP